MFAHTHATTTPTHPRPRLRQRQSNPVPRLLGLEVGRTHIPSPLLALPRRCPIFVGSIIEAPVQSYCTDYCPSRCADPTLPTYRTVCTLVCQRCPQSFVATGVGLSGRCSDDRPPSTPGAIAIDRSRHPTSSTLPLISTRLDPIHPATPIHHLPLSTSCGMAQSLPLLR